MNYIVPESTKTFAPVTEPLLSLSKNSTIFATESMVVGIFKEVLLYILSLCSLFNVLLIEVSINPATKAFDLIPFSPHSRAVFFKSSPNLRFLCV